MPRNNERFFKPGHVETKVNKLERFAELNRQVMPRGAWLISPPGDKEIIVETLAVSSVPDWLRAEGHRLEEIQGGERILPHGISERFTRNADGSLAPVVEGSTQPIAVVTTHAGIVKTRRFSFSMP